MNKNLTLLGLMVVMTACGVINAADMPTDIEVDVTYTDLKELTPSQIHELTPDELKKLTPAQLRELTPEQLQELGPDQLKELSPAQRRAFRKEQFRLLSPEQQEVIETGETAWGEPITGSTDIDVLPQFDE